MAEVIRSGKDRILTNNGNVGLNINDDKMGVNDDNGQVLNIDEAGLVSQDSTDTSRMQIGREVKLSQPDVDVVEANIQQTVVNSEQINGFQIIARGTIEVNKPANSDGASNFEDLDILARTTSPVTFVFKYTDDFENFSEPLPYLSIDSSDGSIDAFMNFLVARDSITIGVTTPVSGALYSSAFISKFRYYICEESAQ